MTIGTRLQDFVGGFGDFETLFQDCELENYVIRFWYKNGSDLGDEFPMLKRIVGYTRLSDSEILLHLIPVEDLADPFDTKEALAKNGIEFIRLSDMLNDLGFAIVPEEQVQGEDEYPN